jgi:hypothetical protein
VTTAPERAIEQRDELGLPADPFGSGQVGKPVLRYGGGDRASGAQRFVADLAFPGALQVALVTVPVGCADVLGIDTTAARAIPGVVDVVTPADLPSPMPRFGVSHLDRPVLADGRVNYHGEPVAAVDAETADAAHAAARAVVGRSGEDRQQGRRPGRVTSAGDAGARRASVEPLPRIQRR